MARVFILILFCFGLILPGMSQVTVGDSLMPTRFDSSARTQDSAGRNFRLTQKILSNHPFFNYSDPAGYPAYTEKIPAPGKEIYFYVVAALFLFFAILRSVFDKYFSDLFNLFFRRSLKQKQIKQQVLQNTLPSLLFNIFFAVVAGYYTCLLIKKTNVQLPYPTLQLLLYCVAGIGIIYLGKYFALRFLGWIFRIRNLTDNYIFLIFLISKIMAILLLPLLLVISVTSGALNTIGWTLSWILLLILVLYRYITATGLVRKESNISFSHFILYALAFEILPTIMLYKGILLFLK